jgi:hypothetical protein
VTAGAGGHVACRLDRGGRGAPYRGLVIEIEPCELCSRRDSELCEDVAKVVVDRPLREEQMSGDLLVRKSFADEPGDLQLLAVSAA